MVYRTQGGTQVGREPGARVLDRERLESEM